MVVKIVLLVIISFFVSSFTIDFFDNAEALKSTGTYNTKYGKDTIGIVCGDKLCNEKSGDNLPNIIVIQVDDLDVLTLDILLENNLMPNLRKHLIDEGTTFTNSFVTNSLCCPSRATLLTGLYSHNHGVLSNNLERGISQFKDNSTLATWLQNSNYRTGFIGKYLNYYGVYTEPTYIPPGWNNWQALVEPSTYQVYNYTLNDNGNLITFGSNIEDYQTDVLANLNKNFIKDSNLISTKKPFFLLTSTMVPHKEFVTSSCELGYREFNLVRGPPRYAGYGESIRLPLLPSLNEQDVHEKPSFVKNISPLNEKNLECLNIIFQGRIEATLAVDDMIEEIIRSLTEINELDNTVIFFTSDNGFLLGQHRLVGKLVPYEEAIRVPLFVRAPGYEKNSINHIVLNNDLAPTIVDFADATSEFKMDGLSLIELMKSPTTNDWRDKFLIEHYRGKDFTNFSVRSISNIYTEWGDSSTEFYDLILDPYQLDSIHNCISEDCKQKIEIHKDWLDELKNCGNGSCQEIEKNGRNKQ